MTDMGIDPTALPKVVEGIAGIPSSQKDTGSALQGVVRSGGESISSSDGVEEPLGHDEKRYCVLLAWISDVIANVPVERCAIVKKMKEVADQDIFCDAELAWLAFMKLPCAINKTLEKFAIPNNGRHNFADW